MDIRGSKAVRIGSGRKLNKIVLGCCLIAACCLALLWLAKAWNGKRLTARAAGFELTVSVLMDGLSVPWGITFTPDGTMLVNQRGGGIKARLSDGTVRTVGADWSDLRAVGEGGLMGMVVDPDFDNNRRFYTCQGHRNPQEIQVISWTINNDYSQATRVDDPLVDGIPMHDNGRHSGCRLRFGADGYLYISTGDAATGTTPQDLTSLAGKVLRVDASNGQGAPGNPYINDDSANSRLIYTYGHRNPQGLALRPGTSQMWVVEHGPDVDDEINLLQKGGNYGWNPLRANSENNDYYEYNPMTDTSKYPSAVEASWSSGRRTWATAGGIFLEGDRWGDKEGWLAVATLKNSTLYLFDFSPAGTYRSLVIPSELERTYNRLRSVIIGPDQALYITSSDSVLRVAPKEEAAPGKTSPKDFTSPPDTTAPQIAIGQTETELIASSNAEDIDQSSWRNVRITGTRCDQAAFTGGFDPGHRVDLSGLPAGDYIFCFAVRDRSDNWGYKIFEFEIAVQTAPTLPDLQDPMPVTTEESGSNGRSPSGPAPITPISTAAEPEPADDITVQPNIGEPPGDGVAAELPPESEIADAVEEAGLMPAAPADKRTSTARQPPAGSDRTDRRIETAGANRRSVVTWAAIILPVCLLVALLIWRWRTAKPDR
ncbi:hypothetical protein F4X86_03325 [Candidatus Saccharibacteria bacterium]|nr:hypothetical protein [Candidatus Saccharibacteria bacterium]